VLAKVSTCLHQVNESIHTTAYITAWIIEIKSSATATEMTDHGAAIDDKKLWT